MQNMRVYSAPSLAVLLKQVMIYRLNGILTIQRATGNHQEKARISIEYGQPKFIQWGSYEEVADRPILTLLNTWGEIHFIFQVNQRPLQLPSPGMSSQELHSELLNHPTGSPHSRQLPSVTRPLPMIPATISTTRIPPEMVTPMLTVNARSYPIGSLSRHDRTIFLLINGQRTISDLMRLTNRSLEDIYTSLYHLRDKQLITVEGI